MLRVLVISLLATRLHGWLLPSSFRTTVSRRIPVQPRAARHTSTRCRSAASWTRSAVDHARSQNSAPPPHRSSSSGSSSRVLLRATIAAASAQSLTGASPPYSAENGTEDEDDDDVDDDYEDDDADADADIDLLVLDEEEEDEDGIKITPLAQASILPERNGRSSDANHQRKRTKGGNPAMQDANFLRKRTADLLKITQLAVLVDDDDGCDIDALVAPPAPPLLSRHMKVDQKTFHFLLDAWAFSGEPDAADQAVALLRRMEELGRQPSCSSSTTTGSRSGIQPDVRSYTKAINAIARHAAPTAGSDAEAVLRTLKDRCLAAAAAGQPELAAALKPNAHTYTAVVRAHAHASLPDAAHQAAQWTEHMVDLYQRGDESARPTAQAFHAVLLAHGRAGHAAQAAAVLSRMEQLAAAGLTAAQPNAGSYNALITAWAHSGDGPASAFRAEAVLERMMDLYRAGDAAVQPTTVSFNAVIDAYAKISGNEAASPPESGGDGATAALPAAAAAERAAALLRHMGDLYDSGRNVHAQPNTRSYNAVLNAWAKSRAPDAACRAAALLETMERKAAQGDVAVRPDAHSVCTVINAYARSAQPDKAERANNLYQDMKKRYLAGNSRVRPNVVAANAVMNACAYTTPAGGGGDSSSRQQNRAVEIAHGILKDLETSPYGRPDQVTYGTFLKTCANQMPDSHTRQQIVEVLFKKCRRDGQVGTLVLQQLKGMASEELYQQLIGRGIYDGVQMEDLPKEWWCNVVEGKWRRRRQQSEK